MAELFATVAAVGEGVGAAFSAVNPVLTAAGAAVSAAGTLAAGKAAKQAGDFEAAQLDIQAKEEHAAAQREAEQLRRRKVLALSTLTANAAGSGFSATDPTALSLAGDIEEYGTMQEQMAMYGGASRRAGREAQADASRYQGRVAQQASRSKAFGTILGGITTLADRYAPPRKAPTSSSYYDSPGGWRTTVSYG